MSANMIGISRKLVTAAELRRLMQGSYEQKIGEISEAVRAHFVRMHGAERPVEIVATHAKTVVVLAEGAFHKVTIAESAHGTPRITEVAPMDVEVYDESNVQDFVAKEATEIVDLFLKGSLKAAWARLEDLAPMVHAHPPRDQGKVVEAVAVATQAPRHWKRVFEERGSNIKRYLLDDLGELNERRLRPKFTQLYDGTIGSEKLSGYADLVEEDLEIVIERLEAVRAEVDAAHEAAQGCLYEGSSSDEVGRMYEGFAVDLIDDLRSLHEMGSRAAFETNDVAARARLRDLLAESLHSREVAGRFVVAVAGRLTEAQ